MVPNFVTGNEPNQLWKLGYPYFDYDYIFGGSDTEESAIGGSISLALDVQENVDFVVDCYITQNNQFIDLNYYEIGSEEYRITSFPLEIKLNVKLFPDVGYNYSDPFGAGFDGQSTFELIDLYMVVLNMLVINQLVSSPFLYRYEVIQWGDEENH